MKTKRKSELDEKRAERERAVKAHPSAQVEPDPVALSREDAARTPFTYVTMTATTSALCPDLLRLSDIGEADSWRGRVVRLFFRVLKVVTGV